MPSEEEIINSIEGKLCVQSQETKEDGAIVKVRFAYAH
jgi:hypothetical protein